ncbi:MAG: valine--tRNA ligase [Myxococcales bacterium]|nr:valine--tRNA ligase [Myxococcota bacterium]MDW8280806.1 valine--tRNA ligase [Myxococcales bacterium]
MTELPKAYDPSQVEPKWYRVWMEQGYFHADAQTPKTPFSIVIPPPNITGSLHMGHAMYVIQDVLVRWRRMQAFNALWLPGTDHAGIATQLVVERMIQREEGKSRHELGREEFVRRVWLWKEKYGDRINEQLRVLGFSLDWERARFTMDEGLSRAVIEAFVRLYEEGLIYRARRLINWCSRCYTALSDLEVEPVEREGRLWHIAYPVLDSDERLVVATTRPETLLGDTAVAVHPEDERFKHLIGRKVLLPLAQRPIPIVADPILVSMEFGTGAVKVTPAHDFNDFEAGQRHGLPQVSVIDLHGRLNDNAPEPFRGLTVAEARTAVLAALAQQGLLVREEAHRLSIGCCQRCDTVIEPTLSMQWFVRTGPLAGPAIQAVEQGKTRFVPEHWTDDYFRWMRNIRDWCISRQLWWGHRIPAYYDPDDESKVYVARTRQEACRAAGRDDLRQDEDVLDTWFSSALWPFSTLGWPEQTRDLRTFYPTSVLETGHDILFFWVARMMMMGLHFMKKVPFRTVLLHALVVDENGEKMSKVKGNVIDPLHIVHGASLDEILDLRPGASAQERQEALEKFRRAFPSAAAAYPNGFPRQGADALRFFLVVMGAQGRNIRLSIPRIEGYRHFMNKIWSAVRFFLLHSAGVDPDWFQEALQEGRAALTLADRWILSRLQRTTAEVDEALTAFRISEAAQALYRFFWTELCDWYIEMVKPQLQPAAREGGTPDQEAYERQRAAQGTLAHVLDTVLRLLHPFIPFITEELWTRLPRPTGSPQSLMITMYPSAQESLIDQEAERRVAAIQTAVSAIRSLRAAYRLTGTDKPEGAGERLRFVLKVPDDAARAALIQHHSLVEWLARVQVADIVADYPQEGGVIANVVEGQTALLLGADRLIDVPAERARLSKEIARVDKDLASLRGRLENSDFVQRAPAEVVEQSRVRLRELEQRAAELREHLRAVEAIGRST